MNLLKSPKLGFAVAALLALLSGRVAFADDSEIFVGSTTVAVPPNILFILDTSGSMSTPVTTQVNYDPTQTYSGSCAANEVYFAKSAGGATPPACSTSNAFSTTYQKCQAAVGPLAVGAGATGPGYYTDQVVQWKKSGNTSPTYGWTDALSNKATNTDVACEGDYPSTAPFPRPGTYSANTTANEWTNAAGSSYWANVGAATTTYTLYSGNYLNYFNYNSTVTIGTRISVVQQAATNLISSLSNVNVGLMRYSDNCGGCNSDSAASGGMVAFPVSPLTAANKASLISTLNSYSADGWTPLSETLYEAYLYYSGGTVHFGNASVPFKSVPASRTGGVASSNQYQSPITSTCQKNFIVYLTDGLPTQDNEADSLITALPSESTIGGQCDDTSQPPYSNLPGGWGPAQTAGRCMSALAKFMFNGDLRTDLAGQQNVQLYAIGFGNDPGLAQAFGWLSNAATAGGGQAYTASDLTGLQAVLTNIVSNILQTSATFTAPTVAVNAFNRTQTLSDLYVAVFQPSSNYHWPGNVKKYSIQNDVIVDANSNPAVDPATGFFKSSAQSVWSTVVDGASVPAGGAANQIPDWNPADNPSRNVFTYIGSNPAPGSSITLTSSSNYAVTTTNPAITNAVLGVTSATTHDAVINYARGEDVKDENGNGSTTDTRHAMGDPLHGQPAVVIYGGTTATPNITDGVVYATENDGFLHAFSTVDGHELWSYIPQELLANLKNVYLNNPTSPKQYSLDGSVRVLKYDINGDGIIDAAAGDRVIIYFGQGRGGSNYYALDVTDPNNPKFLWTVGPTQLAGIGMAWSTPAITQVKIQGATQNSQDIVLVIGGGYDPSEDGKFYLSSDAVGNSLYMVDALYGTLLWSASSASSTSANLKLTRMDHAIPSDVTVLDLDGDGFADRLYVGDMAGQLWQFDIYNGSTVSNLVTGGVIASLGAHDDSPAPPATTEVADDRRFYNAPDAALVENVGVSTFMSVAIGSGYRGHPLDTTTQDRFYDVRVYNPFVKSTQAQYNSLTVLHDADLIDITNNVSPTLAFNAPGWKLLLDQPSGWVGEKVLDEATTFNDQILFTTYTPSGSTTANPCQPAAGTNRAYAISVNDGRPVDNLAKQNNTSIADRWEGLAQQGIAPGVSFTFPGNSTGTGTGGTGGTGTGGTSGNSSLTCQAGLEILGVCQNFNSRLKTYWNESDAQ